MRKSSLTISASAMTALTRNPTRIDLKQIKLVETYSLPSSGSIFIKEAEKAAVIVEEIYSLVRCVGGETCIV